MHSSAGKLTLVVFSLLFLSGFASPVNAATLVVNASAANCSQGTAYYSTIQSAIDAASAGDTIIVCNDSVYTENVAVGKALNLYGNESGVVVNASNAALTVFSITANYVNVSNFTVKDAISTIPGIVVSGSYANIQNCTLSNNYYGLYLGTGSSSTVSNVNISSIGKGLSLSSSSSNTFSNVNITPTTAWAYALYLESSNNNNFSFVTASSGSSSAIGVYQSSNNVFSNINATTSAWSAASVWYNSHNNKFVDSYFDGGSRYSFYIQGDSFGSNLTNVVLTNGFYASFNYPVSQCNNSFTNVTSGSGKLISYYHDQTGVSVDGVDVAQIFFCNVSNSSVSNSNATISRADAIAVWYGSNNSFTNVNASSTTLYALNVYSSSNNTFSNVNATSNSSIGAYVYSSSNNTFSNVNATNAAGSGIAFEFNNNVGSTLLNVKMNGGLRFYASSASYCSNSFTNVTSGSGKPILYYGDQTGASVSGVDAAQIVFCNVSNSSISNSNATTSAPGSMAVALYFGSGDTVSSVNAASYSQNAIYLNGVSDSRVFDSSASSANGDSIIAEGTSGILFYNVNSSAVWLAFRLESASNTTVLNSTFNSTSYYALDIESGSDNNASNNTLYAGYSGCEYNDDCYSAFHGAEWAEETNNSFVGNTIYADYWIEVEMDSEDAQNFTFNDSSSGNKYYLYDGTAAADFCNITTTTYSWADGGSDLPFANGLACLDTDYGSRWLGEYGEDWHPWVGGIAPSPSPSPSPESSPSPAIYYGGGGTPTPSPVPSPSIAASTAPSSVSPRASVAPSVVASVAPSVAASARATPPVATPFVTGNEKKSTDAALQEVKALIEQARAKGIDASELNSLLIQAEAAYAAGDYAAAARYSSQAKTLASQKLSSLKAGAVAASSGFDWSLVAVVAALVVVLAAAYYFFSRKRGWR